MIERQNTTANLTYMSKGLLRRIIQSTKNWLRKKDLVYRDCDPCRNCGPPTFLYSLNLWIKKLNEQQFLFD